MSRRSLRVCWLIALSAAVSVGCAAGSTDEGATSPGDSDLSDGWVDDVSGDETSVDSGSPDSSSGDSTSGDAAGDADDGGDDGGGTCDPEAGLTISCGVGECTVTIDACTEAGVPATCKPKDPGTEICDGKDNDCDGKIDEDLGETTCGTGECQRTQKNCVDGTPRTCTPGTPGTEICNGKDDDCNGSVDDGLGTTTCGIGECQVTVNNCESGTPKTCTPKAAGIEICNGKDDDCDGMTDEDLGTTSCGMGECARTVTNCVLGVPQTCVPGTPGLEICDGKDNDCNGSIDDGLTPLSCGVGECATTAPSCVGGAAGTCTPKSPKAETCNGKDDDCNGSVDDGLPILNCGIGECKNTVSSCVGGVPQTCTPKASSPEACDGKDNDCNGVIDDPSATATMCPAPDHTSSTTCTMGSCKTNVCTSGWVDVDGSFANGCECADSTTPHSCAGAKSLSTIGVGGFKTTSSNNPVVGREDWYTITFLDTKDNKLAHPYIELTTNPADSFRLEVVPGTCAGTVPSCGLGGEGTATGKTNWETNYMGGLAGAYGDSGWQPILQGAYTPVTDVNAVVYVKVTYRAGAVATCLPYTLTFYN